MLGLRVSTLSLEVVEDSGGGFQLALTEFCDVQDGYILNSGYGDSSPTVLVAVAFHPVADYAQSAVEPNAQCFFVLF